MKCKIQSVEDLKKAASKKLEDEFTRRYQQAILDGAMQGIAFVMYTLESRQGWKGKRQQKLFEDMLSVTDLPEIAPWLEPYNAADIRKHIEQTYNIDFNRLLQRVSATPPEE